MIALLRQLSWPELRHHPWRHGAALLAVMLGVALAFSVQLINQSALSEFSAAVRAVNGVPDFELRGQRSGFDEALYERVATHPQVAIASPLIEIDSFAFDERPAHHGERVALKIVGLDALVAAPLSPALMPRPAEGADRLAPLAPDAIFLNPQARQRLTGDRLRVQTPNGSVTLRVQGSIAAQGAALAVMDIAGVQSAFGWSGRLARIDVRLRPGADRAQVLRDFALPADVRAAAPDEAVQRVSNVSRAYRVNLTVLALVALFTGAFLVFSILSLSVAKRQPQFALLGVLGLGGRERLTLVVAESALLGLAGSALGLLLGTALAALALRLLAGDLGGGYFPGVAPQLQFDAGAALVYGALGVFAAVVGGWMPARAAQALAPAQALKGLSTGEGGALPAWVGPLLLVGGVLLALAPPIAEIPVAAYASVACLMLGGIACVPGVVGGLLDGIAPPSNALALLAVERARHQRHTATIAVAGVVASLSLGVALTVMVASFRDSVTQWLDTVLPADLYVRAGASLVAGDVVTLPADLTRRAASLEGVARVASQRVTSLQLDPSRPAVVLIARAIDDPAKALPLVGELVAPPADAIGVFVSEAMVSLYGAAAGTWLALPIPSGGSTRVFVRGVWRDYARQHGAIAIAETDYRRITGDVRVNDLAVAARRREPDRRATRPARTRERARARRRAARVRVGRRDPHDLAAHLRPQLRRHVLAAGGGDRDRVVRHRREFFGAGARASQGVRPARAPGADARTGAARRRGRGRGVDGGRRAARLGARARGQRRAGQGREPAELSLDHGPAAAVGPPGRAVRRGDGRGHADRVARRARRRGPPDGARGQGRLVTGLRPRA